MICPLSPAHLAGLGAFQLYVALLFYDVSLAPLPLIVFVLVSLIAPMLPRSSFYLPVICRGKPDARNVAATFDDGPDPAVTPLLLDLLAKHSVHATFFVSGANADRYPEIVADILSRGHSIGNHSYNHLPFLSLSRQKILVREIDSTQAVLRRFGIVPLAFRPPVGITNSRLWRVLLERGMFCVTYSCRAVDMGNRRTRNLAAKILSKANPGDIIALHDVAPKDGNVGHLIGEFDTLFRGLKEKGLETVSLARLIGKDVMRQGDLPSGAHPAAMFYDGLADTYDEEQFCSPVSISRRKEYALFSARLPGLFAGTDRVLEVGAGTGIFTMAIAGHCREILALDISGRMLNILKKKAVDAGLDNIRTMTGNAETVELPGTFSAVCAFSSLAYLSDLPAFFGRLAPHVEPGGTLYFITARRSLFRLATQIGNAMRQGMWLKAHSRKEIERMLKAAGFDEIGITSHLFKSVISGGMLLEVVARRRRESAEPVPPDA